MTTSAPLKRRALRLSQGKGQDVFLLSLSATDILSIANMPADENRPLAELLAADRAEVAEHIASILSGLDSNEASLLSVVVLGLSSEVRFRSSRGPDVSDGLATSGTIEIPRRTRAGRKPGWILDGFYTLLALSRREYEGFAVPICAVVAEGPHVLRQHFDRTRNTPALPGSFADILLPKQAVPISPRIALSELPSAVCQWLDSDPQSPFYRMISPRDSEKVTRQTPVARGALSETIADSLSSPYGALFPYRNIAGGETDVDGLCNALNSYWSAVKSVFAEAWGHSPKKSRLMHPAGIRVMGRLMNRVLPAVDLAADDRAQQICRELTKIQPLCRWTSGVWEALDGLAWDKLENSTRHVELASNFLIRAYLTRYQ